ncbi:MAG: hypothetical protein EXR74_00435 [Bdellovibrionales bacterium]|nr:hypothetical protein [Bdellovibrionales bacterium]
MKYLEPIAIIGAGCVLPGAANTEEFWNLLRSEKDQFRSLTDKRWSQSVFLSQDDQDSAGSYSNRAAYIDESLFFDSCSLIPRTHQMMLKALKESIQSLGINFFKGKRVGVVLGCMNPGDESSDAFMKAQLPDLKKSLTKTEFKDDKKRELLDLGLESLFSHASRDPWVHYPSSLSFLVHQYLQTQGISFCADSACASSLTAIDLAVQLLESNEIDVAITGGVEGNLGIETYVPFSRLGVLAKENCLPYDSRSDGIIQGEGSVIFVLQRLENSRKEGATILGILEGLTSSSNGSKASLFSPSLESQKKIADELSSNLGFPRVDYIEGHGTGTPVGDLAELTALRDSFSASPTPIFMGSVKALIGHTKGAAGAAGLLKCLLSIKHRIIPPSGYFKASPLGEGISPLKVNTTEVALIDSASPLHMRVCSAGFGGANYHLSITEYIEAQAPPILAPAVLKLQSISLIAHSEISFEREFNSSQMHVWKIPPNVLGSLDCSQVQGLQAVEEALERSLISLDVFDKTQIGTISASHMRTNKIESLTTALHLKRLEPLFEADFSPEVKAIRDFSSSLINLDETSCQSLNSMTSGRVSNEYDLQGTNFHIDADFGSLSYAIKTAELMLRSQRAQIVIVLGVGETIQEDPILTKRETMSCWIFTLTDFAKSNSLPNLGELGKVVFLF